jgi:hypothetical protein
MKTRGSKSFAQPMTKAPRFSIRPKFMTRTQTKNLLEKRLAPIRDKVAIATRVGFDNENGGALNSQTKAHQQSG